ncbi:MAG: hypothetical protein WKG01_16340, partial [Kofleriaceae bacterium]
MAGMPGRLREPLAYDRERRHHAVQLGQAEPGWQLLAGLVPLEREREIGRPKCRLHPTGGRGERARRPGIPQIHDHCWRTQRRLACHALAALLDDDQGIRTGQLRGSRRRCLGDRRGGR